jgi:hypothetical protein
VNTIQSSASTGHFPQMSNGNENNNSHLSYSNSANHLASMNHTPPI